MSGKKIALNLLSFLSVYVLLFSTMGTVPAGAKAKGKTRAPETVYTNSTGIVINTAPTTTAPNVAALYPSQIAVSGMTGTTTRIAVTLTGFTHPRGADLDFLLVAPGGEKYIFASDLVFSTGVSTEDLVLTFADDASVTFPANGLNGSYKPTNGDGFADTFPSPAPAAPYNQPPGATFASVYNGLDPNGTWALYVSDDQVANSGSINNGWSINVTTTGTAATTFTNSALIEANDRSAPSAPYGTVISVTGTTGVISNLKVTLTGFSHTRQNDVDVLLVSPNGKGVIIMSDAGGTSASTNVDLTFDDAAAGLLPQTNTPFTTGSYKPSDFISETADTFMAPAPYRFYYNNSPNNQLSNFNGSSPNGDWALYVVDDTGLQAGAITGGWSLDITTSPAVPPVPPTCSAPSFSPTNFAAGTRPTNFAVADYNNDTKPDVAVTNQNSNDVSILLGNGDGTFGAQSLVSAASAPYSIVAGKFNADTDWDLAVTNSGSNNVSILLGNGNGTFSAPTNFNVGPTPLSIAVGRFNGDSNDDLAVANYGGFLTGSVSILLGNGSGGFTAGTSVQTRSGPAFVAVADLNSTDTADDLVVANFGAGGVSTFFGTGAGTFNLGQHLNTGNGPIWVDVEDFNNDSLFDLRIANYNSDTSSSYTGIAGGTFGSLFTGSPGQNPTSIASADFTGGGTRSEAIALSGTSTVRVLSSTVAVGQNPNAVKAVDLNGDTKPDMITANAGSNDITVLLNHCAVAPGNLFDFNGDNRTDYTVWRRPTSTWFDRDITQLQGIQNLGRPTDKVVSADYDGDRKTDIAIFRPDTGLWIVRDTLGRPIHFINFGLGTDIPAPADYDGDGKADIAVFRPSLGDWFIRRSTDNSVLTVHWGATGDQPVAADYDEDGKADIAVFRPSVGDWYVLRSSDSGFQAMHWGAAGDRPVPGDYDEDGIADFAVWRPSDGGWYVLKSSDSNWIAQSWGVSTDIPVPGDYDGDGRFDFAVWRPSDGVWYVLKSSDAAFFFIPWGMSGDVPVPSAFVP